LKDSQQLATGIALILNATLSGCSSPFLPHFLELLQQESRDIAVEWETLCGEFMRRQYQEETVKP